MRDILFERSIGLTVGAAVTMNQLASHSAVRLHYPLLADAANSVASYQVRNRATLGGNLCNASPCADTAPAVLALDGRVVLYGSKGEYDMLLSAFIRGPGETAIGRGEFVTAIRFAAPLPLVAGDGPTAGG